MRLRNRNSTGLTAVEITVAALLLAALLSTFLPWMNQRERARLKASAAAIVAHTIAIECHPLWEAYVPNDLFLVECVVTNTTPWDLSLRWRDVSLRYDDIGGRSGSVLYRYRTEASEDGEDLTTKRAIEGSMPSQRRKSTLIGAGESLRLYLSPVVESQTNEIRSAFGGLTVTTTMRGVVPVPEKEYYRDGLGDDIVASDEVSLRIVPGTPTNP